MTWLLSLQLRRHPERDHDDALDEYDHRRARMGPKSVPNSRHTLLHVADSLQVFEEDFISRWREKVAQGAEDVTPKMMGWIFRELQWKAVVFQEAGFVMVFDVGVAKSDTAIPEQLQKALKHAVIPWQNLSEEQKVYHPGSDQKILNLVHPSLYPVIFGRTCILRDRVIGLDDCLDSVGLGAPLPVPRKRDIHLAGMEYNFSKSSNGFRVM